MLGEVAHPNTCSGEKRSSRSRALQAPGASRPFGLCLGASRPSTGLLWPNGGTLSVEEAPRGSCHLLPCHGAVVRRGARGLDVIKGLVGRLQHRRLAGVALPPTHGDIHVFGGELNGARATAGL